MHIHTGPSTETNDVELDLHITDLSSGSTGDQIDQVGQQVSNKCGGGNCGGGCGCGVNSTE